MQTVPCSQDHRLADGCQGHSSLPHSFTLEIERGGATGGLGLPDVRPRATHSYIWTVRAPRAYLASFPGPLKSEGGVTAF